MQDKAHLGHPATRTASPSCTPLAQPKSASFPRAKCLSSQSPEGALPVPGTKDRFPEYAAVTAEVCIGFESLLKFMPFPKPHKVIFGKRANADAIS